ncbi:hypothetical protein BS47DRAFT_765394 [Hydnum rufescens UP504]|uniref:Uncharacterized protein n=1 Tax=Hydnum rufescens UP504 TaxID=1448309 RepID=A0A9P6BCV2_9AGAM|nr:hypothetical protein BS47DRAFT_765394 [Hydnum rufescens UP504]
MDWGSDSPTDPSNTHSAPALRYATNELMTYPGPPPPLVPITMHREGQEDEMAMVFLELGMGQ